MESFAFKYDVMVEAVMEQGNAPRNTLPEDDIERLLHDCVSGTMAVEGANGYPYAVPLHFVYSDGRIYFHISARDGLLRRSVAADGRASFEVHETDQMLNSESVIVFGRVREEPGLWAKAIGMYIDKYVPEPYRDGARQGMASGMGRATCLVMDIESRTGRRISCP